MSDEVVAKMALERGLNVVRTVGDIYAWLAVGSIAGTFAAGDLWSPQAFGRDCRRRPDVPIRAGC